MAVPLIDTSFSTGEVSPSIFGRVDLAREHVACSTMRNFFPTYRGPAYSRAGTKFCGYSKQTGRGYRPRLLPFQYSINQGLVLEFGHHYMRVLYNGAYVTENAVPITAATKANPCVITAGASGFGSATANTGGVTASYAPGDYVTLAGGVYAAPAQVLVNSTTLTSLFASPVGSGYAPGDNVTLAGGTPSTSAIVQVSTTQVTAAAVAAGGTGGTNGTQTVTGTTGTGTKFQASVTVAGGAITAVLSISVRGNYTVNPTTPATEPVTGAGLTGAQLALSLGPNNFSITTAGVYTANPAGLSFTQASTTGSGTGAVFISAVMAPYNVTVATLGVYTTQPTNPVAQSSTTGSGAGVTFTVTWATTAAYSVGDWVFVSGVAGMTELNGQTYVIGAVSGTQYSLQDVFGNNIDSTSFGAYVSGGSTARIYTLATIYDEKDLSYIKPTESAASMTLCCVNQVTGAEYPPQDLTRTTNDNWTFTSVLPSPSVSPPSGTPSVSVTAAPAGTTADQQKAYYQYVVTSIDSANGTESIASAIGSAGPATDISQVLGAVTIKWNPVNGVQQYNIYKAPVGYESAPPAGSLFGYVGSTVGTSFVDRNITPDQTQVPPEHRNPFARGAINGVNLTAAGSYSGAISATITTATGSGAQLQVINSGSAIGGFIVNERGQDYVASDSLVISGSGGGGAGSLIVGPNSGTYPGTVAYFQQRRAYGNSLNEPDTYWMSQPGAPQNFDVRTPPITSDAITGSPWATQVNGIQWMVQTSGGLLVMTGLSAWLLVGSGSFATNVQAISPSSQDNVPQAFSGCSDTVPPIKINYDIIYLTSKDSHYYDLPYQLYALSEPIDLTESSSHLFDGYTMIDNAWCEQPQKLMWAVRSDGILLSLTYYKTQQIQGWARHDTAGDFVSCASVTELPVDALYVATARNINGNNCYMTERMDNRLWQTVEDCWCVDCGLSLVQPTPNGVLSISSSSGLGGISGVTGLVGGSGYSAATTATITDLALGADGITPAGTGATATLTIVGGVITGVSTTPGSGYLQPQIDVFDPAGSNGGSGFSATLVLDNSTTLSTSTNLFAGSNVGDVVRAGGGIAKITAYTDPQHVTANVLVPFPKVPNKTSAASYKAGAWTLTKPVSTVTGLNHLAGATVTGLADGNVIPPTVVSAGGTLTLATPASSIIVGLGFQAQLQSVYADAGDPTVQGQRKKVSAVTVRLESSRGVKVGTNQVDGSTMSPIEIAPQWVQMQQLPDEGENTTNFPPKPYNALAVPLRTGDVRADVSGGWRSPGQIAIQQDYPLPAQICALIPEFLPGDTAQIQAPQKQKASR